MNQEITTQNNSQELSATPTTAKMLFERPDVRKKFEEMMGKRSTQFITSVLQIVSSNKYLKNANPNTVYMAAATAATLDLPLNNALGLAYIVPYRGEAQFQMGYRGFIQLAQRTNLFKTISCSAIYEGQIVSENPLTGYEFDFKVKGSKVIGYAAYFRLLSGYEATLYMTSEELTAHGKRFSQTFKSGGGLWNTDFDSMAKKTVLKLLLSKYAPLSVEMQRAVISDQAVINDVETVDVHYVDNDIQTAEEVSDDKEYDRIELFIKTATSEQLEMELSNEMKAIHLDSYEQRISELKNDK